jgi:hypothetical protein
MQVKLICWLIRLLFISSAAAIGNFNCQHLNSLVAIFKVLKRGEKADHQPNNNPRRGAIHVFGKRI